MSETCYQIFLKKIKEQHDKPEYRGEPQVIWHGTRRKETPQEIKQKGFCTWHHPVDVLHEIIEALDHFNKLDKLKDTLVQNVVANICRFGYGEKGLYVDIENPENQKEWAKDWAPELKQTIAPRTCSYALRNPEIITEVLAYAGVKSNEIRQYLRQKYGKPYAIKLKGTVKTAYPILNEATGCTCFEPEDIEEVYECPEVE